MDRSHVQVIRTETSHGQSNSSSQKIPRSFCFGSLIVLSSQSVNRLIIEQLFHLTIGGAHDGSLKVCAVII